MRFACVFLALAGCVTVTNNPCSDGIVDGNESDVDCGGSCGGCANGQACRTNGDCAGGVCAGSICAAANPCSDGTVDGNETDVDCGGSCGPCANGRACAVNVDCASGLCDGTSHCASVNPCTDGLLDGNETDIDCGGSCGPCGDGRVCGGNADCISGVCDATSHCAQPTGLPSSAGADTYSIDPGAGVIVQPGTQSGYGITANVGGSYRVVWTGDSGASGTYREFIGTVWTTGTFTSFTPGCTGNACPLESDDAVSQPYSVSGGQRIDFDAVTTSGLDGFDFSVDTEPVYFDLTIDGQRYPTLVFFTSGGVQSNVATIPFGLTTQ